jgi:hypothetical protein
VREIATEIARCALLHRGRTDIDGEMFASFVTHDVEHAFRELNERVRQIEVKSIPKHEGSGFCAPITTSFRARAIRSRRGYGDGCDTCGGVRKTFMVLTVDGFKSRLTFDLCEACTKRLAAVIDARLEDKTNCFRRKNGVLR